jgi:hypothetical protein
MYFNAQQSLFRPEQTWGFLEVKVLRFQDNRQLKVVFRHTTYKLSNASLLKIYHLPSSDYRIIPVAGKSQAFGRSLENNSIAKTSENPEYIYRSYFQHGESLHQYTWLHITQVFRNKLQNNHTLQEGN